MKDLVVTIIQSDLIWENISGNLKRFSQKINALEAQTDLIVLPEMFATAFSMLPEKFAQKMDGEIVSWMRKNAAQKKCVIAGSVIIEQNAKFFNRLIWMRPDGTYEYYNKRHLFRMGLEHEHYAAGGEQKIVELKGWRFMLLICYDLRFPVWSRTRGNYDAMIYVANWPFRRANVWKTLIKARAHENQAFVIGVNRIGDDGNGIAHSGDSAVISPIGAELSTTKSFREHLETVILSAEELKFLRKSFPVELDSDDFEITR